MYYRQCILQKDNITTTSWIQEKLAKKNLVVKLKEDNGTWTEGWTVTEVGARMSWDDVNERSRDHETQRRGSDI